MSLRIGRYCCDGDEIDTRNAACFVRLKAIRIDFRRKEILDKEIDWH